MLTDPNLKSKVNALWDRFWSGGIANPLTAIEQMSYLIFLKCLEDMDNARAAASKRERTNCINGKADEHNRIHQPKGGKYRTKM
ncbi:MAG: hypothetical protein HY707_10375 [Ignavibacteriae bacterium]|nr:hypothetical protein [Ignavibacteriota bacterium]